MVRWVGQISDFETARLRKDGTLIDVAVAVAPVRDGSGRVVGQMVIYSDISERKLQEARLAEAQQVAHIGSWEWDVPSNRVIWSDEMYRLWGLEPAGGRSYESYLASVHADDRTSWHGPSGRRTPTGPRSPSSTAYRCRMADCAGSGAGGGSSPTSRGRRFGCSGRRRTSPSASFTRPSSTV